MAMSDIGDMMVMVLKLVLEVIYWFVLLRRNYK